MKKIVVVGSSGKMGELICQQLKQKSFQVYEVDQTNGKFKNLGDVESEIDLVVDFSNKSQSLKTLNYCLSKKISLIMGTTGQGEFFISEMKEAARHIPIMKSDNFSENIVKFNKVCAEFSKNFAGEIAVVESHHKYKIDSPSGTAKKIVSTILAENKTKIRTSICGEFDNEIINVYSMRGGNLFGKHEVHFFDDDEEIVLSHTSYSREPFVKGLIKAVEFMLTVTQPQIYSYEDLVLHQKN